MRFAKPHISRRGAFFFIALFSCLQIILGFSLISGKGDDSAAVLIEQAEFPREQVNQLADAELKFIDLNDYEPAAGGDSSSTIDTEQDDFITKQLIHSLTTLSTSEKFPTNDYAH